MFYEFPRNLTLNEVREVVRRHNERLGANVFIEVNRGDHIIFNYAVQFDGAFPQPDTDDEALNREYAIIRECRGLMFYPDNGRVLARRFQKFFNVNEKSFTQAHLIDWSQPHIVMDKLDGSMITPLWVDQGGSIAWTTKMGRSDVAKQVDAFVQSHPHYEDFAGFCMNNGQTPIFEWCSRQQKIVVDYKTDQLILTAIRDNQDGSYQPFEDMNTLGGAFGIPVVEPRFAAIKDIDAFLEEARALEGSEGYIIRFDNGHMLKVKCDWYTQIHRAKDGLTREKEVWQMILNETADDVLPLLDDDDRQRVEAFREEFHCRIADMGEHLKGCVEAYRRCCPDKKAFAAFLKEQVGMKDTIRALNFAIWDGRDPAQSIRNVLMKNYYKQKDIDAIRFLIDDLKWDANKPLDDE